MLNKKNYITTPIYYVNSQPHIGHAYTTINADILARYYRFKSGKKNIFFLVGTDEHGAKVAQSAAKSGKTAQAFTDEISALYQNAWRNLNIEYNDFIRTTEARHETAVEEILLKLKEAKTPLANHFIYKGNYEGLYCVGCEAYKKPEDLVNGKCLDHHCEPVFLKEENWYFKLSDFAGILADKINNNKIRIWPESRKKEVLSLIARGLEDVAISRENVKWGIPIPWDAKQTVYVWVDALINYISALGYPKGKKFKKFWPADVQLLGKDILKFHCLIWPAMLIALEIELPKNLFIHGFYTINGQKISKTVGNVINPNDLVNEFGSDASRYLLVSQFPFGEDGDIKASEFKIKFNADLANGIGNLVSRVVSMAEKYCNAKAPSKKYTAGFNLSKCWTEIDDNYGNYKTYENAKKIWDLIRWCDNYIDENKPWQLAKDGNQPEIDQIIYNLLEIIRHLGWMLLPMLPQASARIRQCLGEKDLKYGQAIKVGRLKGKQPIKKCEPLFARK